MLKGLGIIFKGLGIVLWVIFGLISFIISLMIVNEVAGFLGVVIAFVFTPVMLAVVPWYALIAWGNFLPLLIIYGGGIFAGIVFYIGTVLSGD